MQDAGGDCHVVEKAEAHRLVGLGVVTRRTNYRETVDRVCRSDVSGVGGSGGRRSLSVRWPYPFLSSLVAVRVARSMSAPAASLAAGGV